MTCFAHVAHVDEFCKIKRHIRKEHRFKTGTPCVLEPHLPGAKRNVPQLVASSVRINSNDKRVLCTPEMRAPVMPQHVPLLSSHNDSVVG